MHIFNEPITPASDVKTAGKKPRGNYGVFSSAMAAAGAAAGGSGMGAAKRDAVQRSVLATGGDGAGGGVGARNEIFVDVIEKLNVTFNSSGHLLTSEAGPRHRHVILAAVNPY